MRRARLGAYALWQTRDWAFDRGAPTLLVLLMLGYLSVAPAISSVSYRLSQLPPKAIARLGGMDAAHAAMIKDVSRLVLGQFLGPMVFLGVLLAMHGIVASDRTKGFYRFLFSKPVGHVRYYAQAFAIHWVGFVAVVAGLALLYEHFVVPVLSPPLVLAVAAMFLLYGGIAFLLSTCMRLDWLGLLAATVLSTALWGKYGASSSWLAKLLYLLPPLHRTNEIYGKLAEGAMLNAYLLEWLAGYGLACLVAGFVVLHFRRMAIA
jgi:hypothetical protein